jgi:DNA-binding SARP family transcriptional activator/tetratricopeptide (TPR) repeat protein
VLLARLIVEAGRVVRSERLAEDLWPAGHPGEYGSALRVHITRLRAFLARLAEPGGEPPVVSAAGGYLLDVEALSAVDAHRFTAVAREAALALRIGRIAVAAERSAEALALWRGDPFEGVPERPFVGAEAQRLRAQRTILVADHGEAMLSLGRHAAVEALLAEHAAADTLNERVAGLAAIAHYRSGRQRDALRVVSRTARDLRDELGVRPGNELARIEQAILHHDQWIAAPSTPAEREWATAVHPAPATESASDRPVNLPPSLVPSGPPLVGRDHLVDRITAAVMGTTGDPPTMVHLGGSAGFGRSRLAAEVAQRVAARGVRVIHGWCSPEHSVAFEPFVRALGGAGVVLPPVTDPGSLDGPVSPDDPAASVDLDVLGYQSRREAVFRQFADALVTARGDADRLLVVLDDLHWADPGSLALLRSLQLTDQRPAVQFLTTARSRELTWSEPAQALVTELRRVRRLAWFEVPALGPASLLALARSVAGSHAAVEDRWAWRLVELTGGSPLMCVSLVGDFGPGVLSERSAESLPTTVQQIVERRLDRLDPTIQRWLEAAAVLGETFEVDTLAETVGASPQEVSDALTRATVGGIVGRGETAGCFRFVHHLVHRFVVDRTPAERRVSLHHRALDVPRANRLDPVARARHAIGAWPEIEAATVAEHVVASVREVLATAGFELAFELASACLDRLGDSLSPLDAARLTLLIGYAQAYVGAVDDARQSFEQAFQLGRSVGDVVVPAYAITARHLFGHAVSADGGSLDVLLEALETTRDDRPHRHIVALTGAVFELMHLDDREPAVKLVREAEDLAARSTDPVVISRAALASLYLANAEVEPPEVLLDLANRGLAVTRVERDPVAFVAFAGGRVEALLGRGDLAGARSACAEARAALDVYPSTYGRWLFVATQAGFAMVSGDLERAEREMRNALAVGMQQGEVLTSMAYSTHLYLLRWGQGRTAELLDLTAMTAASVPDVPSWAFALSLTLAMAGREAAAADVLDRACETLPDRPRDWLWLPELFTAAEACSRVGTREQAARLRSLIEPHLGRHAVLRGGVASFGPIDRSAWLLDAVLGDEAGAVERLRDVEARCRASGLTLWEQQARADTARVLAGGCRGRG